MNSSERIIFSGVGGVCGAGLTIQAIWDSIQNGRSAIGPVQQWNSGRCPVPHAAEVVGVRAQTLVEDRKLHKFVSRTDLFGLYAAQIAIRESGLLPYREKLDQQSTLLFNDRTGVFVGSGGGAYSSNYEFFPL